MSAILEIHPQTTRLIAAVAWAINFLLALALAAHPHVSEPVSFGAIVVCLGSLSRLICLVKS